MGNILTSAADAANGIQSANLQNIADLKGLTNIGILIAVLFLLPFIRSFISPLLNLSLIIWGSVLNLASGIVLWLNEILIVINQHILVFIRSFRPNGAIGNILTSRIIQISIFIALAASAGFMIWHSSESSALTHEVAKTSNTF